jgi:ATP-dependent RNA helicase DOB1
MAMEVEDFVDAFRPDLMEAVYMWAKGAKFAQVLEVAKGVYEGSLVRSIRRLEELLRQMASAVRVIGELELEAKFQDAIAKIKRDIVFAASLYL